jgi:hypothetical protein
MRKRAGTILKLTAPSYVENLPERLREDAIKTLNRVFAAAASFNAELDAADLDTTLAPQGRAVRSGKASASALAQLDAVMGEATTLHDRATALDTTLRAKAAYVAPTGAAERIAYESQLREIRDSLRGLSADERLHVYRSSTDPLVIAAVETAPHVLNANRNRLEPFIDPAEVATAVMARAEAADPASATTLREVRSLAEVYRLAVGSVRREIGDAVPGGVVASA